MSKPCVHAKAVDDLAFDVIRRVIASTPVDQFVSMYESSRQ